MLEPPIDAPVAINDGAFGIRERLIVAPATGRFRALPPETITTEGEWVEVGQRLAEIHNGPQVVPVTSRFRGWLMGMLAMDGQPIRSGEALFWVWNA